LALPKPNFVSLSHLNSLGFSFLNWNSELVYSFNKRLLSIYFATGLMLRTEKKN
jgi:hypothetical protein